MFSQSVTIGPEFFRKSFNDYRDKYWAFAREILQNSLDCGSTWIEIKVVEMHEDDQTLVIVKNNGTPMTREILVDKLLSLGSSGKDFQGAVGGFGKAKEILYFSHEHYSIHSGSWRVSGSGAGYNIEMDGFLLGTRSAVTWKGTWGDELRDKFRRFIELCGRRSCKFTLDGEEVAPTIPRFQCDRPLVHEGQEWAQLGDCKFEENLLVVRIAGIPMFIERSDYRRTLVMELQGASGDRLTANRDSLKYPHSTHLRDLITQMAVDRRSALKREEPEYTRYGGPKLGIMTEDEPAKPHEPAGQAERAESIQVAARVAPPYPQGGIHVDVQGRREAATSLLPYEFIVKNCVRRTPPREFDPLDINFSNHAHWLTKAWSGCLLELYQLYSIESKFSIGFVFSEDVSAEHELSTAYGRVYFLNPCIVTRKSIKRRWKRANKGDIAALAAHEFVHGAFDQPYHGEDFAGWQTDVMGTIINHWRRFARHFS